jgi:hypothetical protein
MLELLRQFCYRAGKGLEFFFDSSFEAVCLFALFGIVVSVLLLHWHVRLILPVSPISMAARGAPGQYDDLVKSAASAPGFQG